jgi:hypothetical protein
VGRWRRRITFATLVLQYHKTYLTQEEYNSRLSVFRSNLEVAEQLTATGTSTHGVTKFMDLTPQEFTAMYTGFDAKALRASLGDLPVAKVCFLFSCARGCCLCH